MCSAGTSGSEASPPGASRSGGRPGRGARADVEWADGLAGRMQQPPREPYHVAMRELWQWMQTVRAGINDRVPTWVAESGGQVRTRAEARATTWLGIRDVANRMRPLAEGGAWEQLREPYTDLTARCTACHDKLVATPRDLLAPAAWPAPK